AINSGNSGGALLNLLGELIGINTAILGPNGGNICIGFAIPVNMVKNLSAQILEFGEVRRGLLGFTGGELTPELEEAFGYDTQQGAFVNQVMAVSA
ncbi:trypsin-like serine protease, partial [Motilimonas sp. 1_MG-2023]|uniref:trypsin-like serine protease n=1 Tax=Motilimonas sp. 1_MG-2023 TaxID=3062672 RepID=UPI0026E226E7